MIDNGGKILEVMFVVDGSLGKYVEFVGNVFVVYMYFLFKGGSFGGYYGGNVEIYMNVGEVMGKVMVELLDFGN